MQLAAHFPFHFFFHNWTSAMAVVDKMTLTFMESLLNESMSNALWEQLASTEATGCWPRSTAMVFMKHCVLPLSPSVALKTKGNVCGS